MAQRRAYFRPHSADQVSEDRACIAVVASAADAASVHEFEINRAMELTMDARLRRMWRQFAEPELRGIAGAKVANSATVVAVVNREPGAYEGSRLRETFGDYFEDRGVHFVAAVADSYEDLVRAWFKQVDGSPGRLSGSGRSRTTRCCGLALIRRCDRPRSGLEACPLAPSPIERRFRRLVPHERVEFVAADTTG